MATSPAVIGTLIVVILKARHLPNKRHIGKQTPYCTVSFNGEKRRTKAIHRGGQHPEWDEEVRFTLLEEEDVGDIPRIEGLDPPPLPPKPEARLPPNKRKIKGGRKLHLSVYADDPREPDLVGDVMVDLTEVLTKGETDEWFTLNYKDRYSGEIYLEMTFYSNEPEPAKKKKPKEIKPKNYGGAGSFTPAGGSSGGSASATPERGTTPNRIPSVASSMSSLPSSLIPPSLRSTNTDLYVAPYETGRGSRVPSHSSSLPSVDSLTSELGVMSVTSHRHRRESFPSTHVDHTPTPSNYGPEYYPESGQAYSDSSSHYDPPVTSASYDASYTPQPSNFSHRPRARTSLPTSSGFMPLVPSASSGFIPLPQASQSHVPDASAYSQVYHPVYEQPTGYGPPMPSHTPALLDYDYTGMQVGPSGFYAPHSTFQHPGGYPPAPPASAPPQAYMPSHTPLPVPAPSHSAPPQAFHVYPGGHQQLEYDTGLNQHTQSHSPSTPTSSRPLPQPGLPQRQGSLPPSLPSGSALNLPPPPPLHQHQMVHANSLPLPPPPPLPQPGQPLNVATAQNGLPLPPSVPHSAHSPTRPALPQPPGAPGPFAPHTSSFDNYSNPGPPPMNGQTYPGQMTHALSLPAPPVAGGNHPFPGPPPRPPSSIAQWMPPPPPPGSVHSYST